MPSHKPVNTTLLTTKAHDLLNAFPLFFSIIRTPETYLFDTHRHHLAKPILDFGCGNGDFARIAFPNMRITEGVDVASSRIAENDANTPYQRYTVYSGSTLPYPTASYASVFSSSVLEHIPDVETSISEIARVLKPNGYFLTTVMTNKWEDYLVGSRFFGQAYTNYMRRKQQHEHLFTLNEWQSLFEKQGLTVESVIGYLDNRNAPILDMLHYVSIPSLLSYKAFKQWVPLKNWFKPFSLDTHIANLTAQSLYCDPKESASLFFVCRKK